MVKTASSAIIFCTAIVCGASSAAALQNLLPKFDFSSFTGSASKPRSQVGDRAIEEELLAAVRSQDGRLSNSDDISSLVRRLEESKSSILSPAIAPEVLGTWRLLHTTNADTASPIQRKAVDASKYNIYQNIGFADGMEEERLIVSQVVKFGPNFQLRVDALGSTSAFPLPELTERTSTGEVLGLNILGVSLVGDEAQPDPDRPDSRIAFVFDEGQFEFGEKFRLPYPVPFRNPLFRDAVKGWIDVTYLSPTMRISRGNKGTTFVLVKEDPEGKTE